MKYSLLILASLLSLCGCVQIHFPWRGDDSRTVIARPGEEVTLQLEKTTGESTTRFQVQYNNRSDHPMKCTLVMWSDIFGGDVIDSTFVVEKYRANPFGRLKPQ